MLLMPRQQVVTPQDRLQVAVRRFVQLQRKPGMPNDLPALKQRAVSQIDGWNDATIDTWGGYRSKKAKNQLPHCSKLKTFCESAKVSADYILFGDGAEMRETRKLGENVSRDDLARAIAAHLAPALRQAAGRGGTAFLDHVDGRVALDLLEGAARDELEATLAFQSATLARGGMLAAVRELAEGSTLPEKNAKAVASLLKRPMRDLLAEDVKARETRAARPFPLVVSSWDIQPRTAGGALDIAAFPGAIPATAASLRVDWSRIVKDKPPGA